MSTIDLSGFLNLADHVLGTINQATNGSLVTAVGNVYNGVQQVGSTLIGTINGITGMMSTPDPHTNYTVYSQPVNNYVVQPPPQQQNYNVYGDIPNYNYPTISNVGYVAPIGAQASSLVNGQVVFNPSNYAQPPQQVSGIPNTAFLNSLQSIVSNLASFNPQQIINNINSTLSNTIGNVFNSLMSPINSLNTLASNIVGNVYTSTSGILNNFGLNLGGFASTVDGLVRALIDKLGLSYQNQVELHNQATTSLSNAYNQSINHIEDLVSEFLDNSKLFLSKYTAGSDIDTKLHTKVVLDAFRDALPDFLKTIYDSLPDILKKILEFFGTIGINIVTLLRETLENVDTQIKKLKHGDFKTLDEFITSLTGNLPQEQIFHLILTAMAFIPVVNHVMSLSAMPVIDQLNEITLSQNRTTNLDVNTLVSAYIKQIIKDNKLNDELARKGISNDDIDILIRDTLPLLPIDSVIQLFLRGDISEQHNDYELSKLGYNDYQITLLKKLYHQIPPYSDIVRLADKHLFDENFHSNFGQFTEYPQKFIEWMDKLGFDEYWSKSLWGAHWSLPGLNTAFDMFHRGIIKQEDLEGYLQLTDIMPFFRDHLIELNYQPFTRVDIRRMYQVGTLSFDEMIKAYRDIGYSQKSSEKLAEFTRTTIHRTDDNGEDKLIKRVITTIETSYAKGKIDNTTAHQKLLQLGLDTAHINALLATIDVERDLVEHTDKVKDNIARTIRLTSSSFVNGTVSENEAIQIFLGLGYTTNEANYEVNYLKLERMVNKRDKLLQHAKTSYINHTINNVELSAILNEAGLNTSEQAIFITDVTLERGLKNKKLSEKELEGMYKSGVIDFDEFRNELLGHGYPQKYVGWILAKVNKDMGN